MYKYIIDGGNLLEGKIKVSGAKNAALPVLISSLMTDEECVVHRVPDLRDIKTTFKLLEYLGKKIKYKRGKAVIKSSKKLITAAPYDLVKQMRASVLVAGPLLARFGRARVSLPGGCSIGLRPVDIHVQGFKKLGAEVFTDKGDLIIEAKRLKGNIIKLGFPSVGATEQLIMCASLIPGQTVILNAAMEPEVDDLILCLKNMGAEIKKEHNGRIIIQGVKKLCGINHTVIPDRIEAGTYLIATAAAGGKITLSDCNPHHIKSLLKILKKVGNRIKIDGSKIEFISYRRHAKPLNITTAPYPGFPTDLQAPLTAYMCLAKGESRISEDIFENRFMHILELARMGADISVDSNTAVIKGVRELSGANVMASDLRGGAALVVAAIVAKGRTEIHRVYHIERGYEKIEKKLFRLGVKIKRIKA